MFPYLAIGLLSQVATKGKADRAQGNSQAVPALLLAGAPLATRDDVAGSARGSCEPGVV